MLSINVMSYHMQDEKCVSYTFKTGEEGRRHYCLVHDKMGQYYHLQTVFIFNIYQVLLTCLWGWPVESAKQNSLPPTSWDSTKRKRATSRRRPTLLATTIDSRTCFFMIFIGCPLKKQEGWHDGIFGSCNKMLPWKISIGVRSFQKALQISINIIWWHKSFMFTCHKPTSQRNVLIMFSFSSNVVP